MNFKTFGICFEEEREKKKKKKRKREKGGKKVNYVERDFFYVLLEMNEVEAKIVLFFVFLILT